MRDIQLNIRERRLANGMLILVIERAAHPVVSSMVWYRVGSREEKTGETGVSHFLEHMQFKGTRRLRKGEIDAVTARLGGINNAFTDYDYTAYYFNFARDRYETAFAMEAERMGRSLLDAAEFEREKKVVLEEMRMGRDDPWRELAEAVGSAAFQSHPYHHPVIGWMHDVESMPLERMRDYYKKYYSPDRAVLVVAGDVRAEEVFKSANAYFGKLKSGAAKNIKSAREPMAAEPEQRGERRIVIERETPVRRLMAAFRGAPCGCADDYALDVLGAVLASGHASRLYKKLIKQLRLAVHVSAENEARLDPGLFWISVEAREGVGEPAIEAALWSEIDKIKNAPVSPREIRRAKKLILAGQAYSLESAADIADRVGRLEMLNGWRYLINYTEKMEAVCARDVADAARRVLDERRRTVGWSIPARNGNIKENGKLANGRAVPPRAAAGRAFRRAATERPALLEKSKFKIPPRRGVMPVVKLNFLRETLDNGMKILVTRNEAAPTVSMMAYLQIGVACEPEARAGIENLTGSLLEEGSRRFKGDDIAMRIEETGGFLESGARGVTATALSDGLPLLLEISASVLREPSFEMEAFERLRDETISDLIADEDDLRGRAFRRLREEIYGKHPLHRPGDGYIKTVRKLKRADVVGFYKNWYSPGRAILSVAGDVDPRELLTLAKKHFGSWRAPTREHPSPPSIPEPRAARIVDRIEREQVHIAIGHLGVRRADPDYFALLILDHVLGTGSGFTDRMSRKLRDEDGLAYGVSANITNSAGREPGIFAAWLSTEPKNATFAREGMFRELRRALAEPPTELEVRNAKDYLIGSYAFGLERNSSRAHALATIERHNLGADYFERYAERIDRVSAADVARAAQKHLFPNRCIVVEVGAVER
ncbi:MAG: insulinase family protein [Planctomycetes bacterium]|nr:insulinase family protein [Planctomycetota bacterium]